MKQALRQLIDKLSGPLLSSLESAAGNCAGRGHFYVEVEHWFWQLMDGSVSEVEALVRQFSLNKSVMRIDLEQQLEHLATGHEGAPALSSSLVTLMEDAWLQASLNERNHIHFSHLVQALLKKDALTVGSSSVLSELQKISSESLQALAESAIADVSQRSLIQTASTSVALDKYTQNLTKKAAEGGIDPV